MILIFNYFEHTIFIYIIDPKSFKGIWLSSDNRVVFILYNNDKMIQLFGYSSKKIVHFKRVSESISGYPIFEDPTKTFYLAITSDSILYKEKSYDKIESEGNLEWHGAWIIERNVTSRIVFKSFF